ncbi:MAG: dihydroneopterin aldolase [Fimbriimonadaceae bacterium]
MVTVFVRRIEFYGFHGGPDAEREVGHRYTCDLSLQVDSLAEESDRIEHTADYAAISQTVVEVGTQTQCRTLEKLAADMGNAILSEHPRVQSVVVTLAKPYPPAPIIAAECGVVVRSVRA